MGADQHRLKTAAKSGLDATIRKTASRGAHLCALVLQTKSAPVRWQRTRRGMGSYSPTNVRFAPRSGGKADVLEGLSWATNRHCYRPVTEASCRSRLWERGAHDLDQVIVSSLL